MRRGPLLAIGWALVGPGCEPTAAECGDAAPAVGVFCFPDDAELRVGRGFAPTAMVVLDLDDDGALDVAAVNPSRATLSIHWGDADGGLMRLTSWPLAQELAGITHGDLDGDGRADLATALPGSDAVAVLYNRGARDFQLRTHAAGEAPRGLLAVRLDPEGPASLITANVGDGSVSVWRRGVLGPPTIVGGGPLALAAGDLDGDGALDVAVALRDDDVVQVLHNRGGTLLAGARHRVGTTPTALVAGDLDGDTRVDLASADQLGDTVSVIFGDGRGGARELSRWPVDRQPTGLTIVRGGGLLPVLGVLSEGTSTAARLDPRSGALASAATRSLAGAIAAADLDHDGREELLHGAREGGAIASLRTGLGLTVTPRWSAAPVDLGCVLDLDGDGVDELIGQRDDGTFTEIVDPAAGAAAAAWASGLDELRGCAGVDLAGDGREALLLWGQAATDTDGLVLLRRAGEGWVTQFKLPFPGQRVGAPAVGDTLGDGSLELVVPLVARDTDAPGGALWLVSGLTAEGGPATRVLDEHPVMNLVALDLDGDAALDLAGTLGEELRVYQTIGELAAPRSFAAGAPIGALVAGDLDGDGAQDLLLDDGRVLLGVMHPSAAITPATGERVTPLAVLDLDDDGDLDALARTFAEPGTSIVTLLRNDGAGGFTPGGRHALSEGGVVRAPVRLPDGQLGMAERGADGVVLLTLGVGEVLVEQPGTALAVDDPGELADLDGDGRADIYAARGALAVSFGRAGGLGPTHHVPLVGVDGPLPVAQDVAAGDLRGDGAAELVLLHLNLAVPESPLTMLTRVQVAADGEFVLTALGSLVGRFERVFVRDLDGDGHADLLLASGTGHSYLRGRGDGGFDPALTQVRDTAPGSVISLQAIDGDHRLDLLLDGPTGLRVARGQAGGNFDAPRPWWGGDGSGRPLLADLTGDGRVDLVSDTAAGLTLFPGDGHGVGSGRVFGEPGDDILALAVGDLDGDGARELLAVRADLEGQATLIRGRSTGAGFVFTRRSLARRVPSGADLRLRLRDLDGDAAPDVAVLDAEGMTIVRQRP